jgi:hypothetical protein
MPGELCLRPPLWPFVRVQGSHLRLLLVLLASPTSANPRRTPQQPLLASGDCLVRRLVGEEGSEGGYVCARGDAGDEHLGLHPRALAQRLKKVEEVVARILRARAVGQITQCKDAGVLAERFDIRRRDSFEHQLRVDALAIREGAAIRTELGHRPAKGKGRGNPRVLVAQQSRERTSPRARHVFQ